MSSSLLVVVAAGKCPHLQSRYFGAFPECTQWDPFIRSDCRGLCFTLHSTHKHSNKDISASSMSYTTLLYMQGPTVRTQHIPLFIHKEDSVIEKGRRESVLWDVLFLQSNQPNTDSGSNRSETGRETDSSPGREWLQVLKYLGSSSRFMLVNWPDCDHP